MFQVTDHSQAILMLATTHIVIYNAFFTFEALQKLLKQNLFYVAIIIIIINYHNASS